MVQTILYVWLVLSLCNGKTMYRVQIFVRTVSKKQGLKETNTNIKHQRISLRKLVKAAFFLKSQGMAKPDILFFSPWQHCRADHSGQVGNCRETQLHVTHHGQLYWKNKKHWLTFIIQTGSRSSHIFSGKLISDFLLWHQCSQLEDISLSRTGWEVTIWSLQSMHHLHCVAKTGI